MTRTQMIAITSALTMRLMKWTIQSTRLKKPTILTLKTVMASSEVIGETCPIGHKTATAIDGVETGRATAAAQTTVVVVVDIMIEGATMADID